MCGVAGKGETLDVIPRFLITGRRVAGSSFGGVKGRDQVPQFVDMYLAGDIDVDAFVSHKLTLDDVNRGFELMEAQDGIRSVTTSTSAHSGGRGSGAVSGVASVSSR
jgi:S-(hydroxymethyl)glutathione dehydrogenase/alcohol dehydrogenase